MGAAQQVLAAVSIATVEFVDSATSTSSTVTIPATAQAGDVCYLFDLGRGIGSPPTSVVPAGFTSIYDDSETPMRSIASFKVLGGGDPGATITGMNGNQSNDKVVLVFRPSRAASVSNASIATEVTNSNPTSQVIAAGATPGIALAAFGASAAVDPRSFTPAADGEVNSGLRFYVKYRIFNSGPEAVTVDMDDEGTNALTSFYSEV